MAKMKATKKPSEKADQLKEKPQPKKPALIVHGGRESADTTENSRAYLTLTFDRMVECGDVRCEIHIPSVGVSECTFHELPASMMFHAGDKLELSFPLPNKSMFGR